MTVEHDEKSAIASPLQPDSPVLLVLLGASNLSLGWFALARHMQACLHPRPMEIMVATGAGRAYRAAGGLLNVTYPPIESSEIFEAARRKSESGYRVIALVTDIGNDIMYGVSAEQLIETMRQVFGQLRSVHADVFYTTLPAAFEKGIHPIWFYILRTLLLPASRVSYDEARAAIIQVNQYLREVASKEGHLIPDVDRFLGFDEIHYGWLRAQHAWSHIAGRMLGFLGCPISGAITSPKMIKSYWQGVRLLVGSDVTGLIKKAPEHF